MIYLREKSENDQRLKKGELEQKKKRKQEAQQKAQIDQKKDFMNTVRDYQATKTTNRVNYINRSDVQYT